MQNSAAEFIGQVLDDRYRIEKQLGQKTGRCTFLALDLQTEVSIHPHQFRHTIATNMMVQGMNPCHLMTMTRHRSGGLF